MIPFLDLKAINAVHREELIEAFTRVLDSGWYVLGEEVAAFEREFAQWCGTADCVGVGTGLDALTLSLRAWKQQGRLRDGDEVIVPANTYIATILAILENQLAPVLVEPDSDTFNLDPGKIAHALSNKTRVILPVHLYGRLANMPAIMTIAKEHKLLVLEDAAQAHGATLEGKYAGSWGDAAAFSFYPGKNLGALGDAGAICSSAPEFIAIVRSIRNYGSTKKYKNEHIGVNSRLDELQAALLRVKLPCLSTNISRRQEIAKRYAMQISNPAITLPQPGVANEHVWHLYVIRSTDRDSLQVHLHDNNVNTLVHYPIAPHQQECMKDRFSSALPITESIHNEILSLPISPTLSNDDVDRIAAAVNSFKIIKR